MNDDQAREMRPETTSEHIARDMREGRFPEQSERQMVPVLASLPDEIQVWRSMDALDHIGTWATTRFPAEAVTYVPKADAQAAVALVVEQCQEAAETWYAETFEGDPVLLGHVFDDLRPADGLAAVEALRKDRARFEDALHTALVENVDNIARLTAELAAAKQREAGLVKHGTTILQAAKELAEYASYAEIVGGLTVNRPQVREWCDNVFSALHALPEDENFERSFAALAEVQARDDAPTPPDTWHERRTMLPDGDARAVKARGE